MVMEVILQSFTRITLYRRRMQVYKYAASVSGKLHQDMVINHYVGLAGEAACFDDVLLCGKAETGTEGVTDRNMIPATIG